MIYTCQINTTLGEIVAAAENDALIGLWFIGQKHYPSWINDLPQKHDYPVFDLLRGWLDDYFAGKNPKINITLNPRGTDFQKSVWDALLHIPYGQLTTYGEIAKSLNCVSARAIGGAVGRNPISIIIPCHRVIGASGGITGYAGGIDKKQSLLKIENITELKIMTSPNYY